MANKDMRECPFCGGVSVYPKKEVGGAASMRCPDCGLMAMWGSPKAGIALKTGRMMEFLTERWNTRAGE